MKKLCHYVLLVISVLGISMYVKSDEEWFPDVAAQFGFESWKGTTVSNYIKTVSTIDWSSLNIATNGMQISVSKTMGPNIFRLVICNDVDDVTVLRVDASIWNSVLSAQKGMLWWFAHMTTTVDYSSSTNNIGDRGYTLPNSIIFARNNVAVDVSSYTNAISAEAVARQIDADILQRSTMAGP